MDGKIYSVGYQGTNLKNILRILDKHKVDELIDVRTSPYSKWMEEFSLPNLKATMKERHKWYGKTLGGLNISPIKERMASYNHLIEKVREGKNLCVMCMEANPDDCHRKQLLAVDFREYFGIEMVHLDSEGEVIKQAVTLYDYC